MQQRSDEGQPNPVTQGYATESQPFVSNNYPPVNPYINQPQPFVGNNYPANNPYIPQSQVPYNQPMNNYSSSQPGVSSLYSNIRKNGYQILYLTARAIGQSQLTKNFLNSITQGGYSLPPGPVILSPDRLVPSFKREIIYRKPEVFKIACLRDLRSLFPPNHNPFYAGFGNRETDAIAYQAVGVPPGKIFTINTLGEIRLLNATYSKSYVLINDMVNDMFPGIEVDDKYQASEEYNLVNYFKVNYETLIDFDVSELL